jgi:RHS repeat-associated protein
VADLNTGLSYMQQRYYDPVAMRFLSVDPVAASPLSFSRYWYANNNPYKYIDPDGRYTCKGSSTDCGNLEKAMNFARDAAKSSELTPAQRESVQKVVDFIGKPGDGNNVTVMFRDDSSRGGYATFNKADGKTTLTLRPDNAIKNLGKNAVHEGKHGLTDSERGREDNTRSERLDNEIGAYTVQGYYQKALRFSTSSDDPWTYGGGLSEKNILNKANASVNQACGSETGGSCGN